MQLRLRHALVIGVTAVTALAPFVFGVVEEQAAVAAGDASTAGTTDASTAATAAGTTAGSTAGTTAGTSAGPGVPKPLCGRRTDRDFPIRARIHGGPASYPPGGPAGTFSLDLTNTTGGTCHDIHPVLVLADRDRTLSAPDITLETADPRGRWRTLSLERSDEDEIIAVLDDGSPGYDVPAGRTVTVRARLAFGEDTGPNEVTVSAATVQRRGASGDWVGASDAYLFTVGEYTGPRTEQGRGADPGTGTKISPAPAPSATFTPAPTPSPTPSPASGPELATSGVSRGALLGRIVAAAALLAAGVALFIGVRQLRDRPRA